ncbi:MAG: ABC transporter ATP-binding protein [Herbinix sp.]|nr:ABC transporter ATP-binding protein [Herbinix sp.]
MSDIISLNDQYKMKSGRSDTSNEVRENVFTDCKDAIVIKNLRKSYKDFTLNNISFNVPRGTIMGFVGENGAGKTTTIKAILDLIRIDGGEISILGSNARMLSNEMKAQIGVVFDGSNLHDNMNSKNINYVMKNIYPNWEEQIFNRYIKKLQLPEKKIIKEYSRGMKMKLSIAIALSHHSKLLILDEATSGLDPMVREEILDIFLEFIQNEENTILLSSHIISDIEKIADYVTFIHQGNIIFSESKDDLIYRHGVLHCRREDVAVIDSNFIVGIRENSFGAEVLIRNKDDFKRRYHQFNVEKTSIEEIMLLVSRGKERF